MDRKELLDSAELLVQPSASAAEDYSRACEEMASEMNRAMSERQDVESLIGSGNLEMMYDNHRNHARFMESLFFNYRADVFTDTVLWVYRAYRSHGFHLTYWPAQLDLWVRIMKERLSSDSFKELYPFYRWMIINQPAFVMLSDKMTDAAGTPSHGV